MNKQESPNADLNRLSIRLIELDRIIGTCSNVDDLEALRLEWSAVALEINAKVQYKPSELLKSLD